MAAPISLPLSALTKPHLAGVGEVVVAGYVTPLALVMPHHDHTVLPGQEVAVRLPRVPVFIELGRGRRGGGELKPYKYQKVRPEETGGKIGRGFAGTRQEPKETRTRKERVQ